MGVLGPSSLASPTPSNETNSRDDCNLVHGNEVGDDWIQKEQQAAICEQLH